MAKQDRLAAARVVRHVVPLAGKRVDRTLDFAPFESGLGQSRDAQRDAEKDGREGVHSGSGVLRRGSGAASSGVRALPKW